MPRKQTVENRIRVLRELYHRGSTSPITVADLARMLEMDPNVVSNVLWLLAKEDLVQGRVAGLPRPQEKAKEWRLRPSRRKDVGGLLMRKGAGLISISNQESETPTEAAGA